MYPFILGYLVIELTQTLYFIFHSNKKFDPLVIIPYLVLHNFFTIQLILVINNSLKKERFKSGMKIWPSGVWANFFFLLLILLALLAFLIISVISLVLANYFHATIDAKSLFRLVIWPFFILSFFFLLIYFQFITYAVVLKHEKGIATLRYSKQIVKGHWEKIFKITLSTFIFSTIPFACMILIAPQSIYARIISGTLTTLIDSYIVVVNYLLFKFLVERYEDKIEPA